MLPGSDDAPPDCEVKPQGDGSRAREPTSSTKRDGNSHPFFRSAFIFLSAFQVLTVLCSAYFLVKAMVWLNKSF